MIEVINGDLITLEHLPDELFEVLTVGRDDKNRIDICQDGLFMGSADIDKISRNHTKEMRDKLAILEKL